MNINIININITTNINIKFLDRGIHGIWGIELHSLRESRQPRDEEKR